MNKPKFNPKILGKILRFARIAEAVAFNNIPKVRRLFLIGTLSASWLAYYFGFLFGLSLTGWLLIFLLLLLPSMLLLYVYISLEIFIGLPQRVIDIVNDTKGKTTNFQKAHNQDELIHQKTMLSDFAGIGSLLIDVILLGSDASEIVLILKDILIFSNPIFLLLVGIAAIMALLLFLLSLITVIFYIY